MFAGIRIGAIGAGDGGECGKRVVDGERVHGDAIERAAGRNDAGIREEPEARLEPYGVAQRRWHPARARGIGAERERHKPCGDRERRTRARAARDQRAIEQVARNAVGRAHALEPGGKLIEVGLADDDRARALEPRDAGRVFIRHIGEGGAGGGGRHPGDVDIVLDSHGDPVQRAIGAARSGKRLRLGDRVRLFAQRDKNRGIAMRADARVSARHRRLEACPRAMRRHNRRHRLARHAPRSPAVTRAIVAKHRPAATLARRSGTHNRWAEIIGRRLRGDDS